STPSATEPHLSLRAASAGGSAATFWTGREALMDPLLAALEATAFAQYLRGARWGYAAVNGTHLLGIALLVGAIVPLDLRLLGLWRGTPVAVLARVLVPVAATGLAVAVVAGALLFSIRAREYADLGVLQVKLVL